MPEDSALNSYKSPSLSETCLWRQSLPSSEHRQPAAMAAVLTSRTLLPLVRILGDPYKDPGDPGGPYPSPPLQQRTYPWPGLKPPPTPPLASRGFLTL